MSLVIYENPVVMKGLRDALRSVVPDGASLVFRAPFRWLRDNGPDAEPSVMSNHYDGSSFAWWARDFGHEVLLDMGDIVIARLYATNGAA